MKVLLLGEFSALHKNLKEGLATLGYDDVTIASSGDGWKNIKNDISIGSNKKGMLGKLITLYKIAKAIPKFKNYDVVQFIDPVPFPNLCGINKALVKFIFRKNKKVFLVAAGATNHITAIADFCQSRFKYPELYREIKKDTSVLWSQTPEGRDYNAFFLKEVNGVIPIMYEYAQGYRDLGYAKLAPTVPIPMNIDEVKFEENIVTSKVLVFHGLNRSGVKGTPLIVQAMENIKAKYPNDVEIIVDGHMPLEQYLDLLKRVNVVIDQVYSCSNGVNAIYSLALGKVVIGGGEPEALKEFGIDKSPLIPIQATVESIEEQIKHIILNKNTVLKQGEASRKYVEDVHDYRKVAQKYVAIWEAM